MPVRATADQASAKWLQNLQASTARMTSGAQNVSVAPGQQAAKAVEKWATNTLAAKQKFATNVAGVSLQAWQNAYINIGVPRVSSGAQAKVGKVTNFMNQFLPFLQTGVAKIDAMPSTTLEDGIARATAMIRYNATFKKTATGA